LGVELLTSKVLLVLYPHIGPLLNTPVTGRKSGLQHYLLVTGIVFLATLFIDQLRPNLGNADVTDLSLIYLLIILCCAVLYTRVLTIYCGMVSFVCYTFIVLPFTTGFLGFTPVHLLDPLKFLVVALVTGELAEQSRRNAVQSAIYEQSSQFRTALLRLISHNLRTPITTIKTALNGLMRTNNDPITYRQLLSVAEQEVDRLDRLIRNVLLLSSLEANTLLLQQDWNGLDEVVSIVFSRWTEAVATQQLRAEMPASLPLIKFDFALIEGVLTNLVENAFRHGTPPVVIHILLHQREVYVVVEDAGPRGAAPRKVMPLEPFESSTTGDLGVGLMVCKGLVEAHQGRLWSQFERHKTSFIFSLPLIIYMPHSSEEVIG